MSTGTAREGPESVVTPRGVALLAIAAQSDLAWAIVQLRAGERIVINEALIAAYQRSSSPHSIRALKSDIEAFDAWCRFGLPLALAASALLSSSSARWAEQGRPVQRPPLRVLVMGSRVLADL